MNRRKKAKQLEVTTAFDDYEYILGEHLTVQEANAVWENDGCDDEREVYKVEHVLIRWGKLPEDMREEEGQRGWWVVDKAGRGVGKATCLHVRKKVTK